jgi:hypothetical protein
VAMGMDGALCKRLQTGWGASRVDRELGVDAFGERLLHATLSGGGAAAVECSELLLRSVGLLCAAQGWEWAYAAWLTPTLWPLLFDPDSYVPPPSVEAEPDPMDDDEAVGAGQEEEAAARRQRAAVRVLGELGALVAAQDDDGAGGSTMRPREQQRQQSASAVVDALTRGLAKRLAAVRVSGEAGSSSSSHLADEMLTALARLA